MIHKENVSGAVFNTQGLSDPHESEQVVQPVI